MGAPTFGNRPAPPSGGTVTSVGLSLPTLEFDVTGSPVVLSGTLTGDWKTQNANLVFAGPSGGGAAKPSFRALVDADIPDTITLSNITQITNRSHSDLQNLTADDHTQYLRLGGRVGGQVGIGGTASGNNLTFRSNTSQDGLIILGDDISKNEQVVIHGTESGITIDTTAFLSHLAIHDEGTLGHANILTHKHSNVSIAGPTLMYARSRGTEASETIVQDNDYLSRIVALGFNGTDYSRATQIHSEVDDATPSTTSMGGAIVLSTTPSGSITLAERLRIAASGRVSVAGSGFSVNGIDYVWPGSQAANRVLKTDGSSGLSWGQVAFSELSGSLAHSALTGLTTGDDHTHYLLLAGRTGSGNNALLSTSTNGKITGSSATLSNLQLRASSTVAANSDGFIECQSQVSLPAPASTFRLVNTSIPQVFSDNTYSDPFLCSMFLADDTITINSDPFIAATRVFFANNTYKAGANNVEIGGIFPFVSDCLIDANGKTGVKVGAGGQVAGHFRDHQYIRFGSGTYDATSHLIQFQGLVDFSDAGTFPLRTCFIVNGVVGAGTMERQVGYYFADQGAQGTVYNRALASNIVLAAGRNYFIYSEGDADSVHVGRFRLGDVTVPTALFDVIGKLTIDTNGIVTRYNNIATVSNGIPAEYATIDLTAQGAAIGAGATANATLYAVPAAGVGMYRISWYLKVTRAATSSSTLGALTIKYTDGTDNVAQTITCGGNTQAGAYATTNTGNTTTSVLAGVLIVYAASSTNITYGVAYTSSGATSMQFEVHIKVEKL